MVTDKTIYITSDGKEFTNYNEAKQHDKTLTKTIQVEFMYSGACFANIEVPINASEKQIKEAIEDYRQYELEEEPDISYDGYEIIEEGK